jgi:hypothetical protein
MTKLQRRNKSARAAKKRSKLKSALALLKRMNPGLSLKGLTGVHIRKNKGGSVTVRPIRQKAKR